MVKKKKKSCSNFKWVLMKHTKNYKGERGAMKKKKKEKKNLVQQKKKKKKKKKRAPPPPPPLSPNLAFVSYTGIKGTRSLWAVWRRCWKGISDFSLPHNSTTPQIQIWKFGGHWSISLSLSLCVAVFFLSSLIFTFLFRIKKNILNDLHPTLQKEYFGSRT